MAFDETIFRAAIFGGIGFQEDVTYTKRDASTRVIKAIVDRNAPGAVNPLNGSLASTIIVAVANDATTGISSAEVDTKVDTITLATRVGGDNATHRVVRIVSHDAGVMTLEVR